MDVKTVQRGFPFFLHRKCSQSRSEEPWILTDRFSNMGKCPVFNSEYGYHFVINVGYLNSSYTTAHRLLGSLAKMCLLLQKNGQKSEADNWTLGINSIWLPWKKNKLSKTMDSNDSKGGISFYFWWVPVKYIQYRDQIY